MSNIEIQVLGMVAVAGVAVVLGAAAMCWLRERCLVAARKTRPRSRKAVAKTAVASMMTAGAIWYGGSKGIRESGDMEGQQGSTAGAYEDTLPPLRSGGEPYFTAIIPADPPNKVVMHDSSAAAPYILV